MFMQWIVLRQDTLEDYKTGMADSSPFVLDLTKEAYDGNTETMLGHINLGTVEDTALLVLAHLVASVTEFTDDVENDTGEPDGIKRKLMDVSRVADMGLRTRIDLERGVEQTYRCLLTNWTMSLV